MRRRLHSSWVPGVRQAAEGDVRFCEEGKAVGATKCKSAPKLRVRGRALIREGTQMNDFMRFDSKDADANGSDARIAAGSTQQRPIKEKNYMFVPQFDSLLRAIGITRDEFENSTAVVIPTGTTYNKLLLQVTLANSDFNAKAYLKANPDVAEAIRNGSIEDARVHYVGFGFFEGRDGATPDVDEAWYLRTCTDVAGGVRSGQIASAAEHFRVVGASEGRSPSAAYSITAEQWRKAFKSSYVHDVV
jgi:hypothetical protein